MEIKGDRMLFRCPVCDTPMFEKVGTKIYMLQHHDGQRYKTEIDRELNTPYSKIRIVCGKCGKGAQNMLHFSEIVGIKDESTIQAVDSPKDVVE